jgi:hypothetical protein
MINTLWIVQQRRAIQRDRTVQGSQSSGTHLYISGNKPYTKQAHVLMPSSRGD